MSSSHSFIPLSLLLALTLLTLLAPTPTSALSTYLYHKQKLRKTRRIIRRLRIKLNYYQNQCPLKQTFLFKQARKVKGCPFKHKDGLKAVRRMRKICAKKRIGKAFRRMCRNVPKKCKKALWFVETGEKLDCAEQLRRTQTKLGRRWKQYEYLREIVHGKPSNRPRNAE